MINGNKCKDPQPDNVQKVRDLRTLIPKWDISIKCPPRGLEKSVGKEEERFSETEGMENIKEKKPSKYSRTNTHVNS